MGRVQLQAQLEQQYGISLNDTAIQQVKTQEDVQKLIRETPVAAPGIQKETAPHIYPHWPWNPVQQAIRSAFLGTIAMPLVRFLAKPKVVSQVQEWPSQPMLIVANHVTSYDVPFIMYALPKDVRRRVAVAMSGEMLLDFRRGRNQGNWFLNLVAPGAYVLITGLFNVFPLPQYSGFRRSFRHAGEAVDRGYSVIVFPEGRRSDDGTPQPFKSGAGLLWKELGIPALPVRLSGLGEIKARGERWFRSGKITVSVHQPLTLDSNKSPEELTEELRIGVFHHRA
jgi:long-chain acyl-CoA synthetase